jgi:hypothetical protein
VSQGGAWRHPQASASDFEEAPPALSPLPPRPPPAARREPGERFVDREFFDDDPGKSPLGDGTIRRGTRVFHTRFGEGEVRRVEPSADPTVVAFFPGWGEKKILARFLKLV